LAREKKSAGVILAVDVYLRLWEKEKKKQKRLDKMFGMCYQTP